jgi:hypothetical protein
MVVTLENGTSYLLNNLYSPSSHAELFILSFLWLDLGLYVIYFIDLSQSRIMYLSLLLEMLSLDYKSADVSLCTIFYSCSTAYILLE